VKMTIEVPASPLAQEHLNRNPRVLGYRDNQHGPVFDVEIDTSIRIPRVIASESRSLALPERLSDYPHE
jgi:hypothetical protein